MSVVFFHKTYLGFTETFIYEQLTRLRAFEAHAVALAAQNLTRFPFPNLHLRPKRGPLSWAPRAWDTRLSPWVLKTLRKTRARLIHAHFGTAGALALPYAQLLKIPLVVSYYGFDVGYLAQQEKHPELREYFARLDALFAGAALHLALTGEMRDRLISFGAPPEKVRVHPTGVDLERFSPKTSFDEGACRVLLCGREVEKKGFAYGLRAFARARKKAPFLQGELIGPKGPLRGELEALAKDLDLGESFRFLDGSEDVPRAMRRADILLAPSVTARDGDTEGLPTVLIEAAATGIPAVASRHAGIPDIVRDGETGFLCEERDEEALSKALVRLADHAALRRRMGEAARNLAAREFDIKRLVRRLEGYYVEEISSRPLPRLSGWPGFSTLKERGRGALCGFRHRGDKKHCPCCGGDFRAFLPFGTPPRPQAQCPRCGALERHRLLWLYLREKTDFFTTRRTILHVAPEAFWQRKLKKLPNLAYLSADLRSPRADLRLDITEIPLPDDSFDVILCCHVLEHIPDDQRAMRELCRVLRGGGWAILQSPLDKNRVHTLEDPEIQTPEERARVYGNHDHVRLYGLDYKERLEAAGFLVTVDDYAGALGPQLRERYGLMPGEEVYLCRKAKAP